MKKALFWKMMERFGVQITQFVLQLVLARLLDPDHYGTLSMMIVFVNLANVFVQNGFNTSLVQNKDVREEDYSSVFWVTLMVALAVYGVIFVAAPWIGAFYAMPEITAPLRVLALMLLPGAVNSVQLAKVSREMDFKKVFTGNLAAVVVSASAGIYAAMRGAGLWALVIQSVTNVTTACVVMGFSVRWRPRLVLDRGRIRVLFSYGWKLLVSGLLETFYQEIRSMAIGKKYDSAILGYYNRGKQFPQFITSAVSGTVQSVMLPAMSEKQDDVAQVRQMTRNAIMVSAFLMFPMMAGLAGVATPLVSLLLTEKWLPCVPYLQVYCFTLAFNPVHACNLQAINAVGRSDIFLKLELIKKTIGIGALVFALVFFQSPMAVALTGAFTTITSCFINAYPNKKLIGYSYLDQLKDMLPPFAMSLLMLLVVLAVGMLQLDAWLLLCLQVIAGVVFYGLSALLLRPEPFRLLWATMRKR